MNYEEVTDSELVEAATEIEELTDSQLLRYIDELGLTHLLVRNFLQINHSLLIVKRMLTQIIFYGSVNTF